MYGRMRMSRFLDDILAARDGRVRRCFMLLHVRQKWKQAVTSLATSKGDKMPIVHCYHDGCPFQTPDHAVALTAVILSDHLAPDHPIIAVGVPGPVADQRRAPKINPPSITSGIYEAVLYSVIKDCRYSGSLVCGKNWTSRNEATARRIEKLSRSLRQKSRGNLILVTSTMMSNQIMLYTEWITQKKSPKW